MGMHKSVLLAFALCCGGAWAAGNAERGLEVAREMDARDKGFGDYRMAMAMTLRDKQGSLSVRQMQGAVYETAKDGDKSLIVFQAPNDIRGTAFLTFAHGNRPDDQWLYLPAIKRTKRIASDNRMGSFMGSEFAFEDMGSQELDKYNYRLLGEEKLGDIAAFKLERTPKAEGSGYSRQVVWVDAQRYIPLRIDYYDRKNEPLKTLLYGAYQQFKNKYWRAEKMEMQNQQNGKSTTIAYSGYQFQVGVTEDHFDPQRLEHAH
ncbi:outer membrane lipoprotein-sorting protein [Janthinobacterium fluminis]|uniref:Outer membrane lipoprotein-sorting protein n=1 Tax=Janthinobacterium fluminis TaxID=2987524 RepID=A0ABT5K5B2_9BURK|nr:outer membrane lipoprotein-sorting protein [Janthinobacterium fluminis]MDC8758952.1 outer membrane lipoprotein-sorting protein [Janthinobacterium fluminis]